MGLGGSKLLGAGSFGVVVKPALTNTNEVGRIVKYPGYVSKIFVIEDDLTSALRASDAIQRDIPSLHLEFLPYRRSHTVKNVRGSKPTKALKNAFRKKSKFYYSDAPIFVARMPDLGKSFHKAATKYQAKVNAIPEWKIAAEMLKLFKVVKDIKDTGYVHADIRETNVMINLETGTMTIIDFDWLKERSTYYGSYPGFYYSHPPEEAVILHRRTDWIREPSKVRANAIVESIIRAAVGRQLAGMFWLKDEEDLELHNESTALGVMDIYDLVHIDRHPLAEVFKQWYDRSFASVDMFGLAVALKFLLDDAPDSPIRRCFIDSLWFRITHQDPFQRIPIEEVITILETCIRDHYPEVNLDEIPRAEDEAVRLAALGELGGGTPLAAAVNAAVAQPPRPPALVVRQLAAAAGAAVRQVGTDDEATGATAAGMTMVVNPLRTAGAAAVRPFGAGRKTRRRPSRHRR